MKIAFASIENNLDSNLSPIMGRSNYFIIIELKNGKSGNTSIIENTAKNSKGAGNIATKLIIEQGVNVLISGAMGPVAFHLLKNAGVKVYKSSPRNVKINLKLFNEGELEEITSLSNGFPK